MPPTCPRHTITETEDVARALDDAAQRWPEDRDARTRLLERLVHEGHASLRARLETESGERREALQRTAGALDRALRRRLSDAAARRLADLILLHAGVVIGHLDALRARRSAEVIRPGFAVA